LRHKTTQEKHDQFSHTMGVRAPTVQQRRQNGHEPNAPMPKNKTAQLCCLAIVIRFASKSGGKIDFGNPKPIV
jgi:hypothetical protein